MPPRPERPLPRHGGRALARAISKLGFASRRDAERLVLAGRVRVSGEVCRDPGRAVLGTEGIAVDGREIEARERLYYAMHKPPGFVTTFTDPLLRETVYDLLPEVPSWVFPIGRLDAATSGLLIFTNDSALQELLAGDRHLVEKRYEVVAEGALTEGALESLRAGVEIAAGGGARAVTQPAKVERLTAERPSTTRLAVVIREGKNRQVRRMVEALGSRVLELRRTRIGSLELGDLACGAVRSLGAEEVSQLRSTATR